MRLIIFIFTVLIFTDVQAAPRLLQEVPGNVQAPDFSLSDLDGKTTKLSDFTGKIVIVNFWATWCPPCREEIPSMQRAWNILKSKDVMMLAVHVGGNEDKIWTFLTDFNVEFPVLIDAKSVTAKKWRMFGLPTTYIVDPQGRIALRAIGGRKWDDPGLIKHILSLKQNEAPTVFKEGYTANGLDWSMSDLILNNETLIRLTMFFGIFIVMAMWELAAPRRKLKYSRGLRWTGNLGIVVLNSIVLRILFPAAAVGMAVLVEKSGIGLFNIFAIPSSIAIIGSVVIMDMAIYFQHVLFHATPALWRLHRMHHADLDYDVTTGARFHTIEIVLSMLIKLMVISALGAPPVAVVIFEVLLNATAMFNHSNISLPVKFDRILRLIVVTPDMHRVHHSVLKDERNSNFGFNLPWWDRLFGTYKYQPDAGHEGMTIGLEQFRETGDLRLDRMLIQPFR